MGAAAITEKSHISSDASIRHGRPCIKGSRIAVQDIVLLTEVGKSPDDIVVSYPHITLADVYAALAYYHDHRVEIDESIRADDRLVEELRRLTGPGPLEQRLASNTDDAAISS